MRRRYDLGEMKGFFMQAKQQIPDLCLGTDLMVGFPNENDDDFAKLAKASWRCLFPIVTCSPIPKDKEPRPAGWFKFYGGAKSKKRPLASVVRLKENVFP